MGMTEISEALTTYFSTGDVDHPGSETEQAVDEVGQLVLTKEAGQHEPRDIQSRSLLVTAQEGAGLPYLNDLPFELKCLGVSDEARHSLRQLIDRAKNPAKYLAQGIREPLALLLHQESSNFLANMVRLGIKHEECVLSQFESLVRLMAREAGVPFFELDETPTSWEKDEACFIFVNEPGPFEMEDMNRILKRNPRALFVIATTQIGLFAEGYPFIFERMPEKVTITPPPPLSASEARHIFTALEQEKKWIFSSEELCQQTAHMCEELKLNYLQVKGLIQRAMCTAIFNGRQAISVEEIKSSLNSLCLLSVADEDDEAEQLFNLGDFFGSSEVDSFDRFSRIEFFPYPAEKIQVGFDDVIGAEDAKKALKGVASYLQDPTPFEKMGAKLPTGILLQGPPGVGKTLLARAAAKEAHATFFSVNATELESPFVGLAGTAVRQLFETAKEHAPAVIFIDEIDALGARNQSMNAHHELVNALLSALDGFETNERVVVIGATNRIELIDGALLRPGRFDERIVVNYPTVKEREQLLIHYSHNHPMDSDIDFARLARQLYGATGAAIASGYQMAARNAVLEGKELITEGGLRESIKDVLFGIDTHTRKRTEEERKKIAYHEAGHAVIAKFALDYPYSPSEISIIQERGNHGVVITYDDEGINGLSSEKELCDRIAFGLAGRVAEKLVADGARSVGAFSDLSTVNEIAKNMVMRWGMSSLGNVTGEKMTPLFEEEVKKIIDTQTKRTHELVEKYEPYIVALAETLLKKERIEENDLHFILQLSPEELEAFAQAGYTLPSEIEPHKEVSVG